MIRTFDFVLLAKRNSQIMDRLENALNSNIDSEIDVEGWHLSFASHSKKVSITSNGTDDYLKVKFIPMEVSYESFRELLDLEDN